MMNRTLRGLCAGLILATTSAVAQTTDQGRSSSEAQPVRVFTGEPSGVRPRKLTAVLIEAPRGDLKRRIKELVDDLDAGHKLVELTEKSSEKAVEFAKAEAEVGKALEQVRQVHLKEMGRGPTVVILLLGAAAHRIFMEHLERQNDDAGLLSEHLNRARIISVTETERARK